MTIIKICISRNYIENSFSNTEFRELQLTEEGQGRAISYINADETAEQRTGDIHIGTLNSNGAVQVGNYNTQNIENVLTAIIDGINNSSAPEAEKAEAKSLLNKFLSYPLVNTVLGSAANIAANIIQGK